MKKNNECKNCKNLEYFVIIMIVAMLLGVIGIASLASYMEYNLREENSNLQIVINSSMDVNTILHDRLITCEKDRVQECSLLCFTAGFHYDAFTPEGVCPCVRNGG